MTLLSADFPGHAIAPDSCRNSFRGSHPSRRDSSLDACGPNRRAARRAVGLNESLACRAPVSGGTSVALSIRPNRSSQSKSSADAGLPCDVVLSKRLTGYGAVVQP